MSLPTNRLEVSVVIAGPSPYFEGGYYLMSELRSDGQFQEFLGLSALLLHFDFLVLACFRMAA